MLYRDLLESHFTQDRTISLPLAGDVNIWVFQNTPFPAHEDLTTIIETTARVSENFVGSPFPTTDIILLVADFCETVYFGFGGIHHGSHMHLIRYCDNPVQSIPHETAHYYFTKGPRWFNEGGAQFIKDLVDHRNGDWGLGDQIHNTTRSVQSCIDDYELENIRHLIFLRANPLGIHPPNQCVYPMGEHFMLKIWETIGEGSMSSALRELLPSVLAKELQDVEKAIYVAFLKHAPADRKDDFRDLYRTLHSGPYAYPDTNTSDDHGDGAAAATPIDVGEVVRGELDYVFDFDYFRFHAQEGQRYRMNVNHGTLRASSVGLYAPDGVHRENWNWKSRELVPSGPQIVWIAPSSDEYYFAIQNFGGEAGSYTLSITPVEGAGVDDHGDTEATATEITLGQAIEGTIDDDLDIDYFRFSVVQGQEYRMDVMAGTLEDFRYRISMSVGHFSLTPPRWTYGLYWEPKGLGGSLPCRGRCRWEGRHVYPQGHPRRQRTQ